MTRVMLSLSVLEYCEEMAELVREVRKENRITSLDLGNGRKELFPDRKDAPDFRLDGLLKPPEVEGLDPCVFETDGRLDGMVHVGASGDYGVMNVYVILEDNRGNQIESGFALEDYLEAGYWCYFPTASIRSGTKVNVRAIVMDAGGVGIRIESVTVF